MYFCFQTQYRVVYLSCSLGYRNFGAPAARQITCPRVCDFSKNMLPGKPHTLRYGIFQHRPGSPYPWAWNLKNRPQNPCPSICDFSKMCSPKSPYIYTLGCGFKKYATGRTHTQGHGIFHKLGAWRARTLGCGIFSKIRPRKLFFLGFLWGFQVAYFGAVTHHSLCSID